MARYVALIYGDEHTWDSWSEVEDEVNAERHAAFNAEFGATIVGGNELHRTSTAKSLRAGPDGRVVVTDGPFVETDRVLGGYYVLEAPDLDEAIRIARHLPEASAASSGVEVRPVREMG